MDQLFIDYCNKLQTRSRTLPQFLVPFISILTNLYNAISELSSSGKNSSTAGRDDWESRLTAVTAAQNLSPDLSRLNDILNSQAAAHLVEEEVKGNGGDDSDGEIDTIAQIQTQMPSSLKPA